MEEKNTDIWEKYENGIRQHESTNMYSEAELNHRFYIGDQWYGAKTGGKELPVLNFIKPVGKYKISMIAQNNMAVEYSSSSKNPIKADICRELTRLAQQIWEKSKMDTVAWETIKNAFITGDHYAYWHDDRNQYGESIKFNSSPSLKCRLVNNVNIYFADEQNPNLQEQEYIIISERLPISYVREIGEKNGLTGEELELIYGDDEDNHNTGETKEQEVKTQRGKCTSLLYMEKKDGGVSFCRSVRNVIYEKEQIIKDLDIYPIAAFRWETLVGSARGVSGVKFMRPTQIRVNQLNSWLGECVKKFAFPKMAAVENQIANLGDINKVGALIKLKGTSANNIRSIVDFLNPAPISPDARNLISDTITRTRELEGAGDSVTGMIDPTKASGEAIKAARDQAAVSLNENMSAYRQYVEDTAEIWLKLIIAYGVNGLDVEVKGENLRVPFEFLKNMDVDIKIDVTPIDPYSRAVREIMLKELFLSTEISFEEYVSMLSDSSSMPKQALKEILEARKEKAKAAMPQKIQGGDMLEVL